MKRFLIIISVIIISSCNTQEEDILNANPDNKSELDNSSIRQSNPLSNDPDFIANQNKVLAELLAQGFEVEPGFTKIMGKSFAKTEEEGPITNVVIPSFPMQSEVPITDPTLINQIGQYENQLGPVALATLPELDWDNPTMASLEGESGKMVVVKEVGFVPGESNVNWSVGIHYNNGTLGSAGILKMQWIVPGGDRVSSHHYTFNLDPVFTWYINKRNQYIGVVHYSILECYMMMSFCVEYVYFTQPGVWDKIAVWVTTIMEPYTVLAVAAACMIWNCFM